MSWTWIDTNNNKTVVGWICNPRHICQQCASLSCYVVLHSELTWANAILSRWTGIDVMLTCLCIGFNIGNTYHMESSPTQKWHRMYITSNLLPSAFCLLLTIFSDQHHTLMSTSLFTTEIVFAIGIRLLEFEFGMCHINSESRCAIQLLGWFMFGSETPLVDPDISAAGFGVLRAIWATIWDFSNQFWWQRACSVGMLAFTCARSL